MDQRVQKLAIAIILLTAGISYYARTAGVACWCPEHFAENHIRFTNTVCASKHVNRWAPIKGNITYSQKIELVMQDLTLLKYLAGELILAVGLFSLIKCFLSSSSLDNLYKNANYHRKIPMYILVQAIGGVIWLVFAINTNTLYQDEPSDEPFLCDFNIRKLGNIQRYTLSCIEKGITCMNTAVLYNLGMCIVIASSKLLHLLSIFLVRPLFQINKVGDNNGGGGIGYWFSDRYFDQLALGSNVAHLKKNDMLMNDMDKNTAE